MSHERHSYESTQQPSYHVQAVDSIQHRAQAMQPPLFAPPNSSPLPPSSPPGPHAPTTPLPESLNTLPQFMAHQLRPEPESHQFDDAEESLGQAASRAGATTGASKTEEEEKEPSASRPIWQTAPPSSPPPEVLTSSADPQVASERDEIDDSLVINSSQIDRESPNDVPSPQDSPDSPPPVKTPRKPARAADILSPDTTPNRTPLSKLLPPVPPSRSLAAHRSLVDNAPIPSALDFGPPKRAKTITPQKRLPEPESEDSFAGNPPKIAPGRRLDHYLEKSELLPIPPEMVTRSQMVRDAEALAGAGEDEDSPDMVPRLNGMPAPFRAVSPVSPSPPKRTIILPASSASNPSPPRKTVILPPSSADLPPPPSSSDSGVAAPPGSGQSTGAVIPPRRFAMPSQNESEDTSPSKKSQLFSSQSDHDALFASESQYQYTFQPTQWNTVPRSPPGPAPQSDGSGHRESNGTDGSKHSAPEEATQIVSDLSQQRTAEYLGPIYPSAPSPAPISHSPNVASPAVLAVGAHRRLGRRPASIISERMHSPGVATAPELPPPHGAAATSGNGNSGSASPAVLSVNANRRLTRKPQSAIPEGIVSPTAHTAPPALAGNEQPHAAKDHVPPASNGTNRESSLTPPPTATTTDGQPAPTSPAIPTPKPPANKGKDKRSAVASSPPTSTSEAEVTRRPSKRTRRPPTRFTPEPEPQPDPAPVEEDVDMDAADEESDDDEPVRKSARKGKAPARIPESQPDPEADGCHEEEEALHVDSDASDDELLLKAPKSAKGKKRIPPTQSPAPKGDESEPSEPATPSDPADSDFESYHPTKIARQARQQQLASGSRTKGRRSDVSAVSTKSKAKATPAVAPKRRTRSSIDSSEALSALSDASAPTREVRVIAYWNGTPAGWYIGSVIGTSGDQYKIRFEDKTEAVVPLDDIRRCELREGESLWASGPKAMKKRGELVVSEDWPSDDAAFKVGPQVTTKSGQTVWSVLPKNVFIQRHDPPQEFEDRVMDAADLALHAASEVPVAGPSSTSAAVSKAASTRSHSPVKNGGPGKKGTALAGKTFLITTASDFTNSKIDGFIRAHGGTVKGSWEDLFSIPPSRFGSTLRKSTSTPFVVFIGTPWRMSPKFMVALAAGIPIVASAYIEAINDGQDVEWWSYLISAGHSTVLDQWCSQLVDPSWGSDEWSLTGARNPRQPFEGKTFLFLEPKSNPSLKDLALFCLSAFGAAGCTLVKHVTSQNALGVDFILVETRDSGWRGGVPKALQDDERICNIQWLKECLIMGAALPPSKLAE